MLVTHYEQVTQIPVEMPGSMGCAIRMLLGAAEEAPSFSMLHFEISPGGYTPKHFHDFEHEIYILEGRGEAWEGDTAHPIGPGDVLLVKPNDIHQFRNSGKAPLKLLCLTPNSAMGKSVTDVP